MLITLKRCKANDVMIRELCEHMVTKYVAVLNSKRLMRKLQTNLSVKLYLRDEQTNERTGKRTDDRNRIGAFSLKM